MEEEEEEEETGGSGANTSIYLAASEGLGVSVSDEGEIGFAFLRQTNCRDPAFAFLGLGGKSDDSVAIWAKSASASGHIQPRLDKPILG